jgi:hypothetical protein
MSGVVGVIDACLRQLTKPPTVVLQYGVGGTFMKYIAGLWFFGLFGLLSATGQVLPTSSGSCGISASGVMSCDLLSPAPLKWANGSSGTQKIPIIRSELSVIQKIPISHSELSVIRFDLSPGAPLVPMVEGQDVLIVGMGDGELANETKSPPTHITLRNGSVVLMPKEEHYLLRNLGKQDVDVLVVHTGR